MAAPPSMTTHTSFAISHAIMKNSVSILFFFLLLCPLFSKANTFFGAENPEGIKYDLFPEILKEEAVARLNELGKVSDANGYLERIFQSPASIRAGNLFRAWMEDAGLKTWVDQMGNVHGRTEGINPSEKALLIGSHLDTVIDAGFFDGSLGIICAISALKALKASGRLGKLRRPVETP